MPTKRTFCQREIKRDWRRREREGAPQPHTDHPRPRTRADCRDGPRPCVFVGCRHHLFLEVTPRGGLRVPYGMEPDGLWKMAETCSLDVAERGGQTLQAVAKLHLLTRERVRQIELNAMAKMRAWVRQEEMHLGGDTQPPEMPRPATLWDQKRAQRDEAPAVVAVRRVVPEPPARAVPKAPTPLELSAALEARRERLRRAVGTVGEWAREGPGVRPPATATSGPGGRGGSTSAASPPPGPPPKPPSLREAKRALARQREADGTGWPAE